MAVLKACGNIEHAEPLETFDMADLLIGAYSQLRSPVLVEQVLQEATKVMKSKQKNRTGRREAVLGLDHELASQKIERLCIDRQADLIAGYPLASKEFKTSVKAFFKRQLTMLSALSKQGFHWQVIEGILHFYRSFRELAEVLEQALLELMAKNNNALSFADLHDLLMKPMETMISEGKQSRIMITSICAEPGYNLCSPAARLLVDFDIVKVEVENLAVRLLSAHERILQQETAAHSASPLDMEVLEDPKENTTLEQWLLDEEEKHTIAQRFHASARPLGEALNRAFSLAESAAGLTDLNGKKIKAKALQAVGAAHLDCAYASNQVTERETWMPFILHERERREMARADMFSNLLNERPLRGTETSQEQPPPPAEETAEEEEPEVKKPPPSVPVRPGVAPPPKAQFLETARQKLKKVLEMTLGNDIETACKAAENLALKAYGVLDQAEAFSSLLLLQTLKVCKKGMSTCRAVSPLHYEALLFRAMDRLETIWPQASDLRSYAQLTAKLETMPLRDRMRLAGLGKNAEGEPELPPVPDLMVEHLPPKTLLVSLQILDGALFVAAGLSPAAGGTASDIKYCVRRFQISEVALVARARRLAEIHNEIEKDFVVRENLREDLADRALEIHREVETLLAGAFKLLDLEFFLLDFPSTQVAELSESADPDRVVFLLDQQLWTFPLEQSPFGKRFPAASRDLSFHLFCQRRKALEAAPQGVTVPTIPAASMRLMTDPFAEDIVPAGSMQSLHEALLAEKVVPEGHHGGQWVAEASDFMSITQGSNALLFLGFGRFLGGIGLQHFVSMDLRNLQALMVISNAVNDASFRRQTKFDSNKSRSELELESPYMTAVFASFRGVSTILQTAHPLPIPLAIRAMDHVARELAQGKAMDAILRSMREITVPASARYERAGAGAADGKKKGKKDDKKDEKRNTRAGTPDSAGEEPTVPLFPDHCVAAFQLTGVFGIAKKA